MLLTVGSFNVFSRFYYKAEVMGRHTMVGHQFGDDIRCGGSGGVVGEMLSGMRKFKQTAVIGGVLGLMAGVAAAFGPFISGEAVEGMIERIRRSLPLGEQPLASDNPAPGEDDSGPPETAET